MSDSWIDAKIEEMKDEGDEMEDLAGDLEEASLTGKLNKEVIVVQYEEQNHLTVTATLSNLNLDRVHLIKLERDEIEETSET